MIRKTAVLLCFAAFCACSTPPAGEPEYNLGVAAYRMKDYAAARQHWAKAVDAGDTTAANNLGYLLYNGLGGAADVNRAAALWTRAAQKGERESQWHLGQAFEDGKGVEQNLAEAYAWYRCAAAGLQAAPALDDMDVQIARDASQSLARLLPKLPPAGFEAAEKLAQQYVAAYSRTAAH